MPSSSRFRKFIAIAAISTAPLTLIASSASVSLTFPPPKPAAMIFSVAPAVFDRAVAVHMKCYIETCVGKIELMRARGFVPGNRAAMVVARADWIQPPKTERTVYLRLTPWGRRLMVGNTTTSKVGTRTVTSTSWLYYELFLVVEVNGSSTLQQNIIVAAR